MSDAPTTLAECSQRANAAFDILKAADLTPEQKIAVYDLVNAYLFASDGCTKLMGIATELSQLAMEYMKIP
jgi:hypothetical protein